MGKSVFGFFRTVLRTPAQVSKMQKALEQARMLMKNLGRPRAKAGAKAKAEPKAPPKVEAKAGDTRKR